MAFKFRNSRDNNEVDYETEIAKMEGERNKASDDYFQARQELDTRQARKLFEAGFERAWHICNRQG